ncbi:alternative NADH-dehydrogenase [Histoplasma capsulatum]|uniref:Alternative NADH-dehydrogenase n=1 Tax=Ajellomyces capsulatus TaxID=5037 RepID=A0A8A1M3S8_AJECA|nr:alternative NADH-dehydrogenase [Histoplasma capsulatum]
MHPTGRCHALAKRNICGPLQVHFKFTSGSGITWNARANISDNGEGRKMSEDLVFDATKISLAARQWPANSSRLDPICSRAQLSTCHQQPAALSRFCRSGLERDGDLYPY